MLRTRITIFDTETTGLIQTNKGLEHQPRIASISWINLTYDIVSRKFVDEQEVKTLYAQVNMPAEAGAINGLTTQFLAENGMPSDQMLEEFLNDVALTELFVCHNTKYDMQMLYNEALRASNSKIINKLLKTNSYCTAAHSRKFDFNNMLGNNGHRKRLRLTELYKTLFGKDFEHAHTSSADTIATKECFMKLFETKHIAESVLKEQNKLTFVSFEDNGSSFTISIEKAFGSTLSYKVSNITSKDEVVKVLNEQLQDTTIVVVQDTNIANTIYNLIKHSKYTTTLGFKVLVPLIEADNDRLYTASELRLIYDSTKSAKINKLQIIEDSGNLYA